MSIRNLGGALLAAIAIRLTTGSAIVPGKSGSEIRNRTNAAFEAATRVLDAFDAIETSATGAPALKVGAEQFAQQWTVSADDYRYKPLVAAYLALACHYDGLSAGRSWFRPPQDHRQIMLAFEHEGYALRQKDLFRWTPAISDYMVAARLWTDPAPRPYAVASAKEEAEARLAWGEMPVFVHHRFFNGDEIDMASLVNVVAHSWDGTRWRPFTKSRRFLDLSDASQLAERLVMLAAQNSRPVRK